VLIASDWHDYYDSCSKLGVDKACVYNRETEQIDHKLDRKTPHPSTSNSYRSRYYKYEVNYRLIGFSGAIYPLVIVEKSLGNSTPELLHFYNAEKLLNYFTKEKIKYSRQYSSWFYRTYTLDEVGGIQKFFDQGNWNHFLEYFHKHKVPTFSIGPKLLILNPELKKLGFQQIKDPFTAYQDIHMYISGVIGVEPKITTKISDKDMAESKGHGDRYSFRKHPGTKRSKPRWR
jgi:hypothetical protein